jgi:hypothetical protein
MAHGSGLLVINVWGCLFAWNFPSFLREILHVSNAA